VAPRITGLARISATVQNVTEIVRHGGLVTDEEPSPYEIVVRQPNYKLRRYFATAPAGAWTRRPAATGRSEIAPAITNSPAGRPAVAPR
jgi:putative long chain acyl-CoA synthase